MRGLFVAVGLPAVNALLLIAVLLWATYATIVREWPGLLGS